MAVTKITTTEASLNATPFVPGRNATVFIFGNGKVQGSDDGDSFSDLVAGTADDMTVADIVIPAYIKTSAGSAYLVGGA